ncbi:SCO family protein [Fluviispira multicolorata]|uniref:SCO family protein n=1 Tax=Fluviispira multicolorata TaxID=2654512 RepID=A0A833N5Q2_9BACT|nr:SCO family protein [Fluviispira multicolorata]KAB8030997.1 SCO family protein [Fluviispira multicolorata]
MKSNIILVKIFVIFLCSFLNKEIFAFDERNPFPNAKGVSTGSGIPLSKVPEVMQGVTITEKLGSSIDLNNTFTDSNGKVTKISEMLSDGKPLILTLNYYRCTSLCSLQLVNFANSLKDMGWKIGKDFKIATVSFDPSDVPKIAKEQQNHYLSLTEQKNADWQFYVGTNESIKKLTDEVGFYYRYDTASKEFAHAAAIFIISPEGKISRYLYGITYKSRDIKFSLMDASMNKIGSPTDQILLTCFHYNPTSGKYDAFAVGMLRIGASLTVLSLLIILGFFFWREKRKAY